MTKVKRLPRYFPPCECGESLWKTVHKGKGMFRCRVCGKTRIDPMFNERRKL